MTIQEAIRTLSSAGSEPYCKVCRVDRVDESARTVDCSPIDESAPLMGVNLQANQGIDTGFVAYPTVGSFVVVAFISPAVAVVVLVEKADKALTRIGDTTIEVTAEGVVVNNGLLGGLVKIEQLVSKLNALEENLNILKEIFSAWTPVVNDGGGALKLAVTAWAESALAVTQKNDLEDEKIKH